MVKISFVLGSQSPRQVAERFRDESITHLKVLKANYIAHFNRSASKQKGWDVAFDQAIEFLQSIEVVE